LKLPTGSYGPEGKGRIAEASPGDGDWAAGRLIFDQAVLREDASRVGLGNLADHDANHAIIRLHESGGRSRDELRIVNGGVRQISLR
jgi:hypothetical protein